MDLIDLPSSSPAQPRVHVLEVIGNGIVGGMETCVQRLVERLPQARFRVTALLPYECRLADELRAWGAEAFITPMPDDAPWSSIQTTCALIQGRSVDVLHAHLTPAHVLAGLAGQLTRRPVLVTIHGRQIGTLDLEVHRTAGTHLHVVCQHSYFHALGLGVDASRLSCIPNGVDTTVFSPAVKASGAVRQSLKMTGNAPLIGFVGRLSPEKGPDVFARAALLLHRSRPDARFVIFGDGPMRQSLADFIARFKLADCLQLAGVRSDMPAVYRELNLLVSTSHSEAMPLALMEAMATAVPVVATRVGGVPDLVEHGRSGWLVPPGDFEAVADGITQVLGSAGAGAAMGARGRERAVERLGLAQSVQRTAQLLTQLAEARPAARDLSMVPAPAPRRAATAEARMSPGPNRRSSNGKGNGKGAGSGSSNRNGSGNGNGNGNGKGTADGSAPLLG